MSAATSGVGLLNTEVEPKQDSKVWQNGNLGVDDIAHVLLRCYSLTQEFNKLASELKHSLYTMMRPVSYYCAVDSARKTLSDIV